MTYDYLKMLNTLGIVSNDQYNNVIKIGGIDANIAEKNATEVVSQIDQARTANASMVLALHHINNQAIQAQQSILMNTPTATLPGGINNLQQYAQDQTTATNVQNLINNTRATQESLQTNIAQASATTQEFLASLKNS